MNQIGRHEVDAVRGSAGVVDDGLFRYSVPVSGGFLCWCPPVRDGKVSFSGIPK
jgi:hypothetical protein